VPTFRIEAEGTAHEIYYVDAPDEEYARTLFNNGGITEASVIEIEGSEIIEITDVSKDANAR
jgi:hypothetical protein